MHIESKDFGDFDRLLAPNEKDAKSAKLFDEWNNLIDSKTHHDEFVRKIPLNLNNSLFHFPLLERSDPTKHKHQSCNQSVFTDHTSCPLLPHSSGFPSVLAS